MNIKFTEHYQKDDETSLVKNSAYHAFKTELIK